MAEEKDTKISSSKRSSKDASVRKKKKQENLEDTIKNKVTPKPKKEKACKGGRSFFKRFLKKIFLWLLLIAIILVVGFFLWQKISEVQVEKKYAIVTQELQRCSELTTVKISYSDIVTLKKSAVLGMAKSYSIVKFTGVIRCGIENLGNCRMYIDNGGKNIVLRIPPATVLGNDIQDISVFDEQQSIFVPISTQEVLDQVEVARQNTLQKNLDLGILSESEQQARTLLHTILSNMGFQQVTIQN